MSISTSHSKITAPTFTIALATLIASICNPASAHADELVPCGQPLQGKIEFAPVTAANPVTYRWELNGNLGSAWIGRIIARAADGSEAVWESGPGPVWSGSAECVSLSFTKTPSGGSVTRTYRVNNKLLAITATAQMHHDSVALQITASDRGIREVSVGRWSGPWQPIDIPYNPISVKYNKSSHLFSSAFFDWKKSSASVFDGDVAKYNNKTDGTQNSVNETIVITASPSFKSALPNVDFKKSAFYDEVAGRLILDIVTTEKFGPIGVKLNNLYAAGLRDCVVIIHNWQRDGFDNGFPAVMPPNKELGGMHLKTVFDAIKSHGCYATLHENYIDYYPNYENYSESDIARDGAGRLMKAWLNRHTGLQSYSVKPSRFVALAERTAPDIRDRVGANGSFVDVNSSFAPWKRVDMDAGEPLGGRFAGFYENTSALFAYLNRAYNGPVFGEGSAHFYWTGQLDGVEAQLSTGFLGDSREAPLLVDFDLYRIHPYQVNHGMGYYWRYSESPYTKNRTPWDKIPMETEELTRDIYRTQEIAFGHAPYRSGVNWSDVRLFTQEQALAGPPATLYGRSTVKDIAYWLNGSWQPTEQVIATGGTFSAVRVNYENGVTITANIGDGLVRDDRGKELSKGTWTVYGPGIDGYSLSQSHGRIDYLRSDRSIYADARSISGNWAPGDLPQAAVPFDFGPLKADGQVWFSCEDRKWVVRAYSTRGTIDISVQPSLLGAPSTLTDQTDKRNVPVKRATDGEWSAQLLSHRTYATDATCP